MWPKKVQEWHYSMNTLNQVEAGGIEVGSEDMVSIGIHRMIVHSEFEYVATVY